MEPQGTIPEMNCKENLSDMHLYWNTFLPRLGQIPPWPKRQIKVRKAFHKRHNMISVYNNNKHLLFSKWAYNAGKY